LLLIREIVNTVGQGDALAVTLCLKLFLDTRVKESNLRAGTQDRFAVEFQQHAQYPMGRRMLRPHVQRHAPRRAMTFRNRFDARRIWGVQLMLGV
jgi:hypothetical protein